jgi:hypothetical protein
MSGMIRKTGEHFKQAALALKISFWPVHRCSICNYQCGYMFFAYDGFDVVYDRGCDCTRRYEKVGRSWDAVAESYNMQSDANVIEKQKQFWGFNDS